MAGGKKETVQRTKKDWKWFTERGEVQTIYQKDMHTIHKNKGWFEEVLWEGQKWYENEEEKIKH